MFFRRYLQQSLVSCSILVVVVFVLCVGSGKADEDEDVSALFHHSSPSAPSQNETEPGGKFTQGYLPDASSNEVDDGEMGATPALAGSVPTSATFEKGDGVGNDSDPVEKSTVIITPATVEMPSMIITATKVTLGHRMLPVGSSKEDEGEKGSTEAPPKMGDGEDVSSSPSSSSSSPSSTNSSVEGDNGQRQSRFQRLPENLSREIVTEPMLTSSSSADFPETAISGGEYYKDLEGGGEHSYVEDNEILEQLPTPMALINPNGEGSNPPLEEDFAEAFKKVNPNGKRRRFRGSRKNKMKLKKLQEQGGAGATAPATGTDSSQSESSVNQQTSGRDQQSISGTGSGQVSPTPSPLGPTRDRDPTKFKRVRSTTPATYYTRAPTTTSTTTESPVSTESTEAIPPPPPPSSTTPQPDNGEVESSVPVVRNGPKPMILQSQFSQESNAESDADAVGVTQAPQIEKPSGNTEKISTYFFSTPAPSSRFRLRQKMRDSNPSTSSTTTTTEAPEYAAEGEDNEEDLWKNEFKDFHKTSFFSGPAGKENFQIPSFVPMSLGLESDDRQDPIENSLSRPDAHLENKAYSIIRHSSDPNSHQDYESYTGSSTTPKYRKVKQPTSSSSSTSSLDYNYDSQSHSSPTTESETSIRPEYYAQGASNTEPSTAYPSQRAPAGSHYDRTKDRVIFYNDSPLSAQHGGITTTAILGEFSVTPESSPPPAAGAQTVGTHFSVSESPGSSIDIPLSSTDHYDRTHQTQIGLYTRGQVYPAEDAATPAHVESTFKNGPPDSSHIHSPNMIEHSTMSSPFHERQHPSYQSQYAHSYIDSNHPSAQRPPQGGAIYGTVEEVPAHGDSPYGPPQHHHQMHSQGGPLPYPFGSHSPPNGIPYPAHMSPQGPQGLPPQPPPQPPMLGPPPFHHPSHYPHPPHHHHLQESSPTINFTPSQYDILADTNMQHDSMNDFSPNPNHLAEGHPNLGQRDHPSFQGTSQELQQQSAGESSDVLSQSPSPPDSPSEGGSPSHDGQGQHPDPQSIYEGQQQLDNEFPPHAHTMAMHPDYEPANPPLPHDHPFHNSFIPFPTQDLHLEMSGLSPEQQHDHLPPNPISELGGDGGGPFHPGTVENVPTGRPPFEPSPLIPAAKPQPTHGIEFTPIPDDVKENELYTVYANKPYENHPPAGSHEMGEQQQQEHHPYPIMDHQQGQEHHQQHQHPHLSQQNDPSMGYFTPTGDGPPVYSHPSGPGPGPSGQSQEHHPPGYSGPVTEIHSGTYQQNNPGNGEPQHQQSPHHHQFPNSESFQHHEQHDKLNFPELPPDHHFKLGEIRPEFKSNELGPHDGPQSQGPLDGKKDGNPRAPPFSNTPYVLMFPQLIPEAAMRPSPPSLLQKEIPVVQASSMSDFTSGEKPLGPGLQTVRVHPRDQMYQVLAKAHYDKQMDKYHESKKRPPSAIYTPYGILVPVGTNVDAASSMSHNIFSKTRPPPKFRGEKSLLSALLGSASSTGRFQGPPGNRGNKIMEYEPAIDLLAEKLAMKLVSAQQFISDKPNRGGPPEHLMMSEKIDEGHPDDPNNSHFVTLDGQHLMSRAGPDLKEYLKDVLKDQFHEIVEKVPEENRRQMSLSSRLLNSIFRKGRIGLPPKSSYLPMPGASMMMPTMNTMTSPSPNTIPPCANLMAAMAPGPGAILSSIGGQMIPAIGGGMTNIIATMNEGHGGIIRSINGNNFNMIPGYGGGMMTSASMMMPNKVPPPQPQGLNSPNQAPAHPPSHYHGAIGHPFPPLFPQGAAGLLGSIKRFFNFGPPDRYDLSITPNFAAARNMLTGNGTSRAGQAGGPSPRSGFQDKFPKQTQPQKQSSSNGQKQQQPQQQQKQQQQQKPAMGQAQPSIQRKMLSVSGPSAPFTYTNSSVAGFNGKHRKSGPATPKPNKKKKSSSSSSSQKKPTTSAKDTGNKLQSNRLISSPPHHPPSIGQTPPPMLSSSSTTTTPKPRLIPSSHFNKNLQNNITSSSGKPSLGLGPKSTQSLPYLPSPKDKHAPFSPQKPEQKISSHPVGTKKPDPVLMKKMRRGHTGRDRDSSSSTTSPSPPTSSPASPSKPKPTKLDMFQTLLGSTRSVLNCFKTEVARKPGPTVLKPRSAIDTTSNQQIISS